MALSEEKKSDRISSSRCQMNWNKIAECVAHELYPKLSNTIKSIIQNDNKHNIGINDFNDKYIDKMIDMLKDKQLSSGQQKYIYDLCKRATIYTPMMTEFILNNENASESNQQELENDATIDLHEA